MRCNGNLGYEKCVIDMDGQQSKGGTICCDRAEDCGFDRASILQRCDCAVATNEAEKEMQQE